MVWGDHFWLPKLVWGDHFWLPKLVWGGTTFGKGAGDHFWATGGPLLGGTTFGISEFRDVEAYENNNTDTGSHCGLSLATSLPRNERVHPLIDTIGHAQGIGNDHSNRLIFHSLVPSPSFFARREARGALRAGKKKEGPGIRIQRSRMRQFFQFFSEFGYFSGHFSIFTRENVIIIGVAS